MNPDAENRDSQETFRADGRGPETFLLPGDVARAIRGADTQGAAGILKGRTSNEVREAQRKALIASGILPRATFPNSAAIDARGTEHVVRFRGKRVEKYQVKDAWVPVITPSGKFGIAVSVPTEYLRRLELQNEMFGDDIRVTASTRGSRFVTTQPTLKGGEPTENEIRDVLQDAGWNRIPMELQDLPIQLMGSAWWHDQEDLVLLDARKPNFKKTDFGVLPIDLILADITEEMKTLLK